MLLFALTLPLTVFQVNFFSYKKENNVREIKILRRYHIQDREDYVKYNKIVGHVTELVRRLKALDQTDPFRMNLTEQLLDKLYTVGAVPTKKSLAVCDKLAASSICRRRLPVVIVRLKMAQTLREAVTFVEQGHVRVGPDVVTDPAFLVTRPLEDFITWTDSSKIKRKVRLALETCFLPRSVAVRQPPQLSQASARTGLRERVVWLYCPSRFLPGMILCWHQSEGIRPPPSLAIGLDLCRFSIMLELPAEG